MKIKLSQLVIDCFIIVALTATLIALPAIAYHKDNDSKDHKPCHYKMMKEDFTKDLMLTAEQQKKVDAIMEESKTQTESLKTTMMEKKKALKNYMMTETATQQEALKQQNELSQIHDQLKEMYIKDMFKIKAVLTPEQLKKCSEIHQKKMKDYDHEKKMKDCDREKKTDQSE